MPVFNHPTQKLGKRAVQVDPRTLQFKNYSRKALQPVPPPPPTESWILKPPTWGMMLNDQLGDCVVAAMGHMIEQWTYYASGGASSIVLPDSAILKGYEDIGGYVPGDPSTDQGCDMLTALKYWRNNGLAGHKIVAFMQVDPTNQTEIQQATWLFGNVFTGIGLPLTAQDPVETSPYPKWTVPPSGPVQDGSPWSWGGHCVPIMGASAYMTRLITWGSIYAMTKNFIQAYCDELYAVVSQEWIDATSHLAPSGFDLQTLLADLAHI